jgi:hypothetical protein
MWKASLARSLKRMNPRPVSTIVVETTDPATGKVTGTKTKKHVFSNADIKEIIHAVYITQEAIDNYRPAKNREPAGVTVVAAAEDDAPARVVEKIKRTTPKLKEV